MAGSWTRAAAGVGIAVAVLAAPAQSYGPQDVDILQAILSYGSVGLHDSGESDEFWVNMAAKIAKKAKLERANPPGPSLLAGDPTLLRYTALSPAGKLVFHTTEASRGDVTAQFEAGWPASGGPYGEGFLQFNLHGPDGEQVAAVGLQAFAFEATSGGVSKAGVYLYSHDAPATIVQVPITIESGGSSVLLRGTLTGQALTLEVADGATGEFNTVLTIPDFVDGEAPEGHNLEFGFVGFETGAVLLSHGGEATGAVHEFTGPALEALGDAIAAAYLALAALEGEDLESGRGNLGIALAHATNAYLALQGITEDQLLRAGLSAKAIKAAGKATAAGMTAVAKAHNAADASVADTRNTDKGLRKLAEAGMALKGLSKKLVKTVLAD